jgi:hypothetical protein
VSPSVDAPDPKLEGNAVSLLREDAATGPLRQRLERPARIGMYALAVFGAVTGAAGAGLWLTNSSVLGVALAIFGTVLILLGVVQYRLLRRDVEHWPDRALLWEGGVELVLHNGEVRGVSWTDSDLALDLVARHAPPPVDREFLLVWMSEGRIPSVELSSEGFALLRQAAANQQLAIQEHRKGRDKDGTQWIEIRPNAAGRLAASHAGSSELPAS